MKITVKHGLLILPSDAIKIAQQLINKGFKPGTFNYGFMTVVVFEVSPIRETAIQVRQKYGTNRKSDYSPLEIIIEKHNPII